jgi:hypothetical protein
MAVMRRDVVQLPADPDVPASCGPDCCALVIGAAHAQGHIRPGSRARARQGSPCRSRCPQSTQSSSGSSATSATDSKGSRRGS